MVLPMAVSREAFTGLVSEIANATPDARGLLRIRVAAARFLVDAAANDPDVSDAAAFERLADDCAAFLKPKYTRV